LSSLQQQLSGLIKYKIVERAFIPSYIFSPNNVIVVIGQDGLVANTAKYSRDVPIVAVNPDKSRYDGVLLPYDTENFIPAVESVIRNQYNFKVMRFAEARLNDGQRLLAFNDVFVGAASHVSARYKISFSGSSEEHSSSGLIVSTKAGSTGWLSSMFNMANGVTRVFGKKVNTTPPALADDELLFVVREPFKSIRTNTSITTGIIRNAKSLSIESLMPNGGVVFSDGIENDFLKFNSGTIATIGLAEEKAIVVVP
jgi:hypothetical protein